MPGCGTGSARCAYGFVPGSDDRCSAVATPAPAVPDENGLVPNQAGRGVALVQGDRIDEGFEAGTRLAAGIDRPVELAVFEVVSPPTTARIAPSNGDSPTRAPVTLGACDSSQVFFLFRLSRIGSPTATASVTLRGARPRQFSFLNRRAHLTCPSLRVTRLPLPT